MRTKAQTLLSWSSGKDSAWALYKLQQWDEVEVTGKTINLFLKHEERRVLYVALTRAKDELFVTRSTDYRSGFYLQNKPPEGEEYFLTEVPDQLVEHEICGWTVDSNTDLSSLKDIY